ncbi:MAG: Penicillin-binding protein 1A [Parcubacteria group bacterium GW2011_GWA2_47_7]|nr:MAG: Penicillin-binding protein 1A [Parcubacteria group bacterium GW2011_GWA2_47_7]
MSWFKKSEDVPEKEKRESGDRRKPNLLTRFFLAIWVFIWGIVCFFGRLIKRFLIALGVAVLLIGVTYFFAEDIIRGIDNWKPQFLDAHFGSDREAVLRLHDPGYFAEQTDFVSEDQKSVACISSPERRVLITDPADIPPLFKDAIIASEDKRFYEHEGVDKEGVIRAAIKRYFLHTSTSGASTLTMQMAKDLRHGAGRASTPKEKVSDIIMALRIEQEFSKGQLLEKYTNTPYLGRGAYGIEAASRVYFGLPAKDLKLHQVAFVVSLINKPGLPDRSFANNRSAKTREQIRAANWQEVKHGTRRVLERMSDEGKITPDDYTRAADAIDNNLRAEVLQRGANCGANGYFAEYVRQDLIKRGFRVDKGGLSVSITRDDGIQNVLEQAVKLAKGTYCARHTNDPECVDVRAGAVAIEFTGDVLAEVGNIDFRKFKFDVMAQGFRSPGSTFKPFVYGTLVKNLVEEVLAGENPPQSFDELVG